MRVQGVGTSLRSRPSTGRLAGELLAFHMSRSKFAHELAVCRDLAQPGTTAIDVGAYVGTFALALSKSVGRSGTVFAFEPQHELYQQMRNATWASRVIPLNMALSSTNGPVKFQVPIANDNSPARAQGSLESHRSFTRAEENEVLAVRLDDLLGTAHDVSMMKIDVEGHEWSVIQGAAGVIKNSRPALVVEIEQRHLVDRTVADVVEKIAKLGDYRCEYIVGQTTRPWSSFDLHRDQLRWVDDDGNLRSQTDPSVYANNFVFTAAGQA